MLICPIGQLRTSVSKLRPTRLEFRQSKMGSRPGFSVHLLFAPNVAGSYHHLLKIFSITNTAAVLGTVMVLRPRIFLRLFG
jgi:hypothetical protein